MKETKETKVSFLRRQADLCTMLSRSTFDLTVAGQLRVMAEELRERAMQYSDNTDCASPFPARGGRAGTTDRD